MQGFDFLFKEPSDFYELLDSWFSKCTKVLMNIHKIEDESCRTYIFEYFFKFLSYRFAKEPKN